MTSRGHLELATDDAFQRTEWRLQRIAWVAWAMLLLVALLGLTGPGWFSSVDVTAEDESIAIGYDRFLHYHNPSQLEIAVNDASDVEGRWQVKVGRSLLDRLQIVRIEPEPERREIAPDGIVYTFLHAAGPTTGKIVFHVEYERYGTARGTISLAGRSPVDVNQFVFP
jgi:hypothetical protein